MSKFITVVLFTHVTYKHYSFKLINYEYNKIKKKQNNVLSIKGHKFVNSEESKLNVSIVLKKM